MKQYILITTLILSVGISYAQQVYTRKYVPETKICNLLKDSNISINGSDTTQYCYWNYDASGRITTKVIIEEFKKDTIFYEYNQNNRTNYPDKLSGKNYFCMYYFATDSVITAERWFNIIGGSPVIYLNKEFTHQTHNNEITVKETYKYYVEDTIRAEKLITAVLVDNVLKSEQINNTPYIYIKPDVKFSYQYKTYNSDTIIDYRKDSILDQYQTLSIDSTVSIKTILNGSTVTSTIVEDYYVQNGIRKNGRPSKSIDTLYANGSSVHLEWDTVTMQFTYKYRTDVEQSVDSIVMIFMNYRTGGWIPQSKTVKFLLDGKCGASEYEYNWSGTDWTLGITLINYYQGRTFLSGLTEKYPLTKCNLINPFAATYPFSCSSLRQENVYTLNIYDISGRRLLATTFQNGEVIRNLSNLPVGQLYFFVVTSPEDSRVVIRQKILLTE